MDRKPPETNPSLESVNAMETRHDFPDAPRRQRAESRPEIMLGIWLLGTFFVTGLVVGWVIA